mgnify:CR=1 FL=1
MEISEFQHNLDIIWIIIAAALVIFMQAGFTALESGLTRAKNSINVAMKNLVDFIAAVLVFWLIGYGLMFGDSWDGWWGTTAFALDGVDEPMELAIFVFQVAFAGTAATIVSGAVAERMRFATYVISAIVVVAIIYPVSGHWIWASGGWLAEIGFVDFAGSTVVHSLGGWVGLAGALLLGPRLGRFDADGKPRKIHGQSLVLAVIGVIILWFGWFGFNGGSTLTASADVAAIIANTLLAAAAGGLSCFVTSLTFNGGQISIEKMLNGVVGGLVAITAGAAAVTMPGALFIGLIGGVVVYFSEEAVLHWLKVDDPVNVISAHGVAGAWGTLALALFAPLENLPLDSRWAQFMVQAQGVIAVFLWGFITGLILFGLFKAMRLLRVSEEAEHTGLNIHEHGASNGMLETLSTMNDIVKAYTSKDSDDATRADLTKRVTVEFGSEGYELAVIFNQLMDYFHNMVFDFKDGMRKVLRASESLAEASREMQAEAQAQDTNTDALAKSVDAIGQSIDAVDQEAAEIAESVTATSHMAQDSQRVLRETVDAIMALSQDVQKTSESITDLQSRMSNVESIVTNISSISDQTNLLALNAAIEAARAGDSGRGFAVVAEEVRSLSKRTFEATGDIEKIIGELKTSSEQAKAIIAQSHDSAEGTISLAGKSGQAIDEILSAVVRLASMAESISGATNDQTGFANDIRGRITAVTESTKQGMEGANKVSDTSAELDELAGVLDRLVATLQVSERGHLNVH